MIQYLKSQFQPNDESIFNAHLSLYVSYEPIKKLHWHFMKKWKALEVVLNIRLDSHNEQMTLYTK